MIAYFDITSMDKMLIKIVFREEALALQKVISFKMQKLENVPWAAILYLETRQESVFFLFLGFLVLHIFCWFVC